MRLFATAAILLLASDDTAFAQTTPPPATVAFTTAASMPSLKDDTKKDTFQVGLSDSQVLTTLQLTCQAGRSRLLILHTDRACEVSGNGSIINPSNGQKLQRTQYMGGYTVKSDGSTDGSTMSINYLALGKAPASTTQFSGNMNLRPENTSTGAAAIRDAVLKKINADNTSGAVIDQRVDTVDISRLYIPSAGFPSDKGCTWSGNMVFAYQTNSWFMNLTGNCNGKDYAMKGNMPWTKTPGVDAQTQYDLTLTLPSAGVLIGGGTLWPGVVTAADAQDIVARYSFAEWVIARNRAEGIPWTPLALPPMRDGTTRKFVFWRCTVWLTRDAAGALVMDRPRNSVALGSLSDRVISSAP